MPTSVEITTVTVTGIDEKTIFTDARIVHNIWISTPINVFQMLDNDDNIIMQAVNINQYMNGNVFNPVPFLARNGLKVKTTVSLGTNMPVTVFHTHAGR